MQSLEKLYEQDINKSDNDIFANTSVLYTVYTLICLVWWNGKKTKPKKLQPIHGK